MRRSGRVSNSLQFTVSRENNYEVLGKKLAQGDVSWPIGIYAGSLLKQINGDALAVDDKDSLSKDAYVHQFTCMIDEHISGGIRARECHHNRPSVGVTTTKLDLRHVGCRQ